MASTFPYETSSEALLHPAVHAHAHAPFFKDWVPAVDNQEHGHALLCAEMSRLAYATEGVVKDSLAPAGFTLLEAIGSETLRDRAESHGTQGFIARSFDGQLTVLAFRGTESGKVEDLFVDGAAAQADLPDALGCLVHKGFLGCWACVKERVMDRLADRQGELLITGHSLGAAIATVAAIDLKPEALILFGSPLVGNDKLASRLDPKKIRRYVNCCDLVTRVPPEQFDQEHVSRLLTELANIGTQDSLGAFLARRIVHDTAGVVGSALHLLRLDPRYAHVAPPLYIDRTGTAREGIAPEDIRKDQEDARGAYQRSLTSAPFRDLADHTPLNYVSAFTGRR